MGVVGRLMRKSFDIVFLALASGFTTVCNSVIPYSHLPGLHASRTPEGAMAKSIPSN
jgi:hypothetical protein